MSQADTILDARGLLCPLPVLKARKRLQPLAHGAELTVITDDPAAIIDMPHFCNESGHELVNWVEDGSDVTWTLKKNAP